MDRWLRLVAFSFEIIIGGFNGHPRKKFAKIIAKMIFDRIFEQKRFGDEDDGLLEYGKSDKNS